MTALLILVAYFTIGISLAKLVTSTMTRPSMVKFSKRFTDPYLFPVHRSSIGNYALAVLLVWPVIMVYTAVFLAIWVVFVRVLFGRESIARNALTVPEIHDPECPQCDGTGKIVGLGGRRIKCEYKPG